MRSRIPYIAIVLLICCAVLPGAQENRLVEAWQLYEEGKAHLEDPDGPELGEALLAFQEAIDKRGGVFPEAEMAIGDIYFREGAYGLAERQYEKALELSKGMEIAEEKYTVLYRFVELYEIQERYADMERYLNLVLEDQPFYAEQRYAGFRTAFLAAYREKGLDQLFQLYRMEDVAFAVRAHAKLGRLYYRTGRYNSGRASAVLHSLFALDIMVSEAVEELRRVTPGFEFTTVEEFLNAASKRENIRRYLVESDFFASLYYLASSSYAASSPGLAEPTWRLLATYPLTDFGADALRYAERAARQLEEPWIDPYINPSVRRIEYPRP